MSRAYDDMVRARRGVIAEEIVEAHKMHNGPRTRVNQLLEQLPALLAELIPLIAERDAVHRRLGQELPALAVRRAAQSFPPANPSQRRTQSSPNVMVEVPRGAVADAVAAGVAQARVAAAERQRAAAYGEA